MVTLGDGAISVDGMMVRGSRLHERSQLREMDCVSTQKPVIQISDISETRSGKKWCSCREHTKSADGFMPLEAFSERKDTFDGKHVWCRDCVNTYQRKRRRQKAEAEGRTIRDYRRDELLPEGWNWD